MANVVPVRWSMPLKKARKSKPRAPSFFVSTLWLQLGMFCGLVTALAVIIVLRALGLG